MTTETPETRATPSETWPRLIGEMVSPAQVEVIKGKIAADEFGSRQLELTMDLCYGEIWPGEVLSLRERSLVTLATLVGLQAAPQLGYQTGMALRNGVTPREVEEVILQCMPYAGICAADLAATTCREALRKLGVEVDRRAPAAPEPTS